MRPKPYDDYPVAGWLTFWLAVVIIGLAIKEIF